MKLQTYMAERGLTDAEMAHRLGVDRTWFGRIRRGLVMPSGALAARIRNETEGLVGFDDLFVRSDAA